MFTVFILVFLISSIPQFGGACGCEDKPQVNILAVVNGVKITKQELGSQTQNTVSQLQEEVVKARSGELQRQINSFLLEAEAKRRAVSSAKLLELEVSAKVVQPTDDDAKAFYNERKERFGKDFKKVKVEILAYLKAERERIETLKFAALLRNTAVITVLVQDVTPPVNEQQLDRVFAKVNDHNITSRDIEASLAPLIFKVQQRVYETRKADLDLKINDMLLEDEAKRQNTTPQAILAREIRGKLPVITDQQARAFYNENKSKFTGDFPEVKFQIIQYLMDREQRRLTETLAAELRKNAAVQIYLTPPEPAESKRAG
jgi:hypothetical protein